MFHFKNKSVMKTTKFFAMAAIVCGFVMSLASCSTNDIPVYVKPTTTISFENAKLNADGYWCGDENGTKFENYGSDAYACSYTEAGVTFPVNYTPAWGSWSGFAISNRTATTYNSATMTPDQYNNCTGKAVSGNNFLVVQTYGESIEFEKAVTVKGFWYTNSAWVVDAILNGDGMTPGKFEAEDWFKCIISPTPAEGLGGARFEIDLAKDGDYVKEWKYCDLSDVDAFKNIKSISFAFDGTKKNDWGVTTPAYICIDDIVIEK
jgi:hypothetical protein